MNNINEYGSRELAINLKYLPRLETLSFGKFIFMQLL